MNKPNNSTTIKAKPTEYCGVRFRSKSEAVFAAALTIGGWRWIYEPETDDGHTWDFYVHTQHHHFDIKLVGDVRFSRRLAVAHEGLIEFKPRRPTDSYIMNLANMTPPRMQAGDGIDRVLVYGDHYRGEDYSWLGLDYIDEDASVESLENAVLLPVWTGLGNQSIQQAAKLRFDLPMCEFTAADDTGDGWRVQRLRKAHRSLIASVDPRHVKRMHDHEGHLEIYWNVEPSDFELRASGVAWDSVGESAAAVENFAPGQGIRGTRPPQWLDRVKSQGVADKTKRDDLTDEEEMEILKKLFKEEQDRQAAEKAAEAAAS